MAVGPVVDTVVVLVVHIVAVGLIERIVVELAVVLVVVSAADTVVELAAGLRFSGCLPGTLV